MADRLGGDSRDRPCKMPPFIKRGGHGVAINGTAVLAFGIAAVLGVAVYNNQRANAASSADAAVEMALHEGEVGELPPNYFTNPATSPLAGVSPVALTPARPIQH